MLGTVCSLVSSGALASSAHFDRISLRLAGTLGEPEEDVSQESVLAEVSGHWSLGRWWVFEIGAAEQRDSFEQSGAGGNGTVEEVTVAASYGWLGGRLVVPSELSVDISAAVRRHRGRMLVDDDDRKRLGYDWGEIGLHWLPERTALSLSGTLRQYWWANNDRQLALTGELITLQQPVAFGIDLETWVDRTYIQIGGSVHYRF